MFFRPWRMLPCLAVVVLLAAPAVPGRSLTVTESNLERLADTTVDGERVGDLLPATTRMFIRQRGLRVTVVPSRDVALDPRYQEATRRYSGGVSYDSRTQRVHGYRAGTPFPEVSSRTSYAGWKAMFNYVYGAAMHSVWSSVRHSLAIDNESGLDREQVIGMQRYRLYGRLQGEPVEGTGDVFQLFFLRYLKPQSRRGRGLFTIRYADGRPDNAWAYISFLGRTRRLSGNFWEEPLTGSQFHYTDLVPPHPSWYRDFELVRRDTILGSTNNEGDLVDTVGRSPDERYRFVDLSRRPYWAPNPRWIQYEPRPVYVVKGTPPSDHRFGASLFYIDTELNLLHLREDFDDEGNLWRQCGAYYTPRTGETGIRAWYGLGKYCVDVQNGVAAHGASDIASSRLDPPEAAPDRFNLSVLRQGSDFPIDLPEDWE